MAFLPHLACGTTLGNEYALTWAAAPDAPIKQHRAEHGEDWNCFLFGEPHDSEGQLQGADDLAHKTTVTPSTERKLNGYYAAVSVNARYGVQVEADVLGVFPIYYWQSGEVLLVGTSPDLFRCHASFSANLDLHGVAALLLTSGIVDGRTLLRGVRRLAPDHRLVWRPGNLPREETPGSAGAHEAVKDLETAAEIASGYHRAFLKTALASAQRPGLLLSGGLDSRLLAGFLTEMGLRPACLTFGRKRDLDARCATHVARELGLQQTLIDAPPEQYAAFASSSVQWEELSGGLYAVPLGWNLAARPPAVSMDRIVCGLTLDAVIGGPRQVADTNRAVTFERLRIGRLGLDRSRLKNLVEMPEFHRACDEVCHDLVDTYRNGTEDDHLREWRMNLSHRHRFAVGVCAWRYSLFRWPVLPALDRRLLQLAAVLPHSIVRDRQVQIRTLVRYFPRLAELELDRNYLDTLPLVARGQSLLLDSRRRLLKLGRRIQSWFGEDPRFYVRTMAFNGPGWRVIRALADEARVAAATLFNPRGLAELVPPATVKVRNLPDPIIHSTPLKNTLGLMLWLRQQI